METKKSALGTHRTYRSGWGLTAFHLYAHYTIILFVTYIITQYTVGNRRLKILCRIANDQPRSCKNISSFGTSKKRSTSEKYLRKKRVSFAGICVLRVNRAISTLFILFPPFVFWYNRYWSAAGIRLVEVSFDIRKDSSKWL